MLAFADDAFQVAFTNLLVQLCAVGLDVLRVDNRRGFAPVNQITEPTLTLNQWKLSQVTVIQKQQNQTHRTLADHGDGAGC